ncbi:DMT family transporter [Labrenzia sp. DG1229]|uniref:DMT family transporter n=1 Tax=Labrenzia sp. DG1229 TaxID=681847 RepID=UPI0006897163|nr:DMT family transporter [Labrenzia sp. DG1229]
MRKANPGAGGRGRDFHSWKASALTVAIGTLVGGNFVLAKYVVLQGIAPFVTFYWQVTGAAVLLSLAVLLQGGGRLAGQFSAAHCRYYVIGGVLGISVPQTLGYSALREVPAGLFTMAVTLSPLLTFLAASIFERRLLPPSRALGLFAGLAGVFLATSQGLGGSAFSLSAWAFAMSVPVFLAITNVFRDKAYPTGGQPLFLAAGTLGSQVVLLVPVAYTAGAFALPLEVVSSLGLYLIVLMLVTALSYFLTFELYRHTDGVGFSQVGYFATLSGVGAGALVFGERISGLFAISIALLFAGMALANRRPGRINNTD